MRGHRKTQISGAGCLLLSWGLRQNWGCQAQWQAPPLVEPRCWRTQTSADFAKAILYVTRGQPEGNVYSLPSVMLLPFSSISCFTFSNSSVTFYWKTTNNSKKNLPWVLNVHEPWNVLNAVLRKINLDIRKSNIKNIQIKDNVRRNTKLFIF